MATSYERYNLYEWQVKDPITQQKMQRIEDGIYDVSGYAIDLGREVSNQTEALTSLSNRTGTAEDSITTIQDSLKESGTIGRDIKKLKQDVASITTNSDKGAQALSAIQSAIREASLIDGSPIRELTSTLADVISYFGTKDANITDSISELDTTLRGVIKTTDDKITPIQAQITDAAKGEPSLKLKIDAMDGNIASLLNSINDIYNSTTIKDDTTNPPTRYTLVEQFTELNKIYQEVVDARSSEANNTTYTSLDLRLQADENKLNTVDSTSVKRTDVKDGFTFNDTDLPLSANKGKELRDIIGGSYDPYNQTESQRTTVTSAIALVQTNATNYTNSLLGNGFTDTNTVAKVIDDLESAYQAADTAINEEIGTDQDANTVKGRIKTIEDEIADIRVNNGPQTLDARFDAVEGRATTLETTVHTIANELAMLDDQDAIKDTNTKIDNLERDVQSFANELAMGRDEFGALIDTNTRIDNIADELVTAHKQTGTENDQPVYAYNNLNARFNNIEGDITDLSNAIDHVHSENDELPDGLTQRITAVETSITGENGINAHLNTIDTVIGDANGGLTRDVAALKNAVGDNNSGLTSRVKALEDEPKSATVIIPNTRIIYTTVSNVTIPTLYTDSNKQTVLDPTEDADYLLQGESPDVKYYYWKYMGVYPNGSWNLISGGDSDSGNNNAEVFTTTQAFNSATKAENKDYYVLDNQIWHHYRYIYDDVNTRYDLIEIGQKINTNYIKRYNIDKSEENNITYLDLYELPYGPNREIDPINDSQYLIAHIALPVGGGGIDETEYRLYGHVIGDQTIRKSAAEVQTNGGKVILRFGYTCYAKTGEGENDYGYKRASYVLTAEDGTIIKSSNGNTINYLTKNEYAANNYSPDLVFDVTNYYNVNETNAFTLTLTADVGNNIIKTKSIDVYVNIIQLSLISSFTDANPLSIYNSIEIPFTFNGMENTDYTMHVLFDNQPITFTINRGRIIIAPNQLANQIGVHALQIYASQDVNSETLNSNNLYYQLGLTGVDSQNSIMLFSGTSLDISEVEQYKILNLPYTLYIPNGVEATQTVTIRIDQVDSTYTITTGDPIIRNENLTAGKQKYPFRINKMYAIDEYYLVTISCTNANTIIFKVHVKQAEEQIEIRSNNLVFNFDPMNDNYTNTLDLEHRLWQQTKNGITYKMRVPEGAHFDWRTGGWTTIKDENNNDISCFCVKAGSRVEFVKRSPGTSTDVPLTLFWHDMETTGSNFKCVFKIDNVKSPTAQFLTSLDNTEHRITQYGNWVEDKYQDTDLKKTLLSTYLNVKTNYIYYYNIDKLDANVVPEIDDGENAHDDNLGTTVLASEDVAIVEAIRIADETDARKKNQKKIKEYIHNIYTIISQIDPSANYNGISYKTFLLTLLQGGETLQEEEEGKDPVEEAIIRNLMTLTDGKALVATQVYENLIGTASGESAADIALIAAYREYDAAGFNAITNGFVVEGKEKKDGIIAKLQFYIKAITKSFTPMGNAAVQTISTEPISTNPNAHTKIYRVTIGIPNEQNIVEEPRIYEVNIAEVYDGGTFLWNKVAGLRDATVTESHRYGLELNASGSYMYLPTGTLSYAHSEGDIIEFEYNVNSELDNHIDSSVIIYEDGVPSAADIYTRGKGIFEQYDSTNNLSTAQSLTIGSDECDVYIFKMRLYDEALENSDILANFYADGLTPDDMSERYNRNKKLVDVTSAGREITPSLVAEACPDLRVIMIEAPRLTGGKTSFIKDTKIRCIYKNGRPEDNWVALNAYHAGQGTSSDNYGAAGRNLDIMFGFNGEDVVIVPKPQKNNYSFDSSYVSTLIKGIDNTLEANQDTILDEATYRAQSNQYQITTDGSGTISLNASSVPNNWFNIKLNIASSENVNNAYLQKRFDTYLPYKDIVPARKRGRAMNPQLDIKNDMEFVNCVVFIKETGTPSEFTNDKGENRSWHFYGIGNIGDSKKTDNTRINVPGDPQEFAVELSDNGLKNSEFSTGVFYTPLGENETYTEHELSLTPNTAHECTTSEYTNDNGYVLNISDPNTSTLYLIKEVLAKYTQYHRFMYINSQFIEIGRPIAFENLEVGIRYPISRAEWKTSLNTYQKQLNNPNRAKGWDKSFEFRYDLTTKDGETIERNELEKVMNDMHQEVNKQKFVDLYEWIVMSSNDDFKNHLSDWFIEKSPLYWYLFTERYTMIDSRAKNTFYHYGKIYISDNEYNGTVLSALNEMTAEQYLAAHDEIVAKGNITALQIAASELAFQQATAQSIYNNRDTFLRDDPANNSYPSSINNGYRFELWDYDNDTALGINNNGQMVFDAGLEDIDKTTSGWVYNAAESVIWCRIRDNMYDKLSQLYIQLKATDCFNDESLIEQFDTLQEQFPEELWRLDFERKYFRPFKDSGETTYLSSMANGRKKYQRRQFERNMAIYISSKYLTNASYIARDQISFRPNRDIIPANEAIITVKPYSTMYINFMIGNAENDYEMTDTNAKSGHIRVKANEAYQIHARDFVDRFQNFQCVIYNACRIMAIEGIDKFECKQFIFSNAKKLTTLKLGGDHENNGNVANIGDLGLNSEIPLLEELDISNIRFTSPPAELSLDRFPILKKFNAENSNIQHFTFKDGGMVEEIKYFPSDMDKINFKNLYKLSTVEFQENANFSNLSEYTSENSFSNSYSIVINMLNSATITKLILNDINWTITDLIELEPLTQLQQRLGNNMVLQGSITITGSWSEVKFNDYKTVFGINNITWYKNINNQIPEFKLSFYLSSEDVNDESKIYYSKYVSPNEGESTIVLGDDPVYIGECHVPTKSPTISKTYYFGTNENTYRNWTGWKIDGQAEVPFAEKAVQQNLNLVAIFGEKNRTYPLYWYLNEDDTAPFKTISNIEYGGSYEDLAPTILDLKKLNVQTYTFNSKDGIHCDYNIFKGWNKAPINLNYTFLNEDQDAFCIYGNWDTGKNVEINTLKNQEALTSDKLAQKLLALSNTANASSIMPIGNTIEIDMGYDNDTGTTIIGKDASIVFGSGLAQKIYDENNILKFEYYYNQNNQLTMEPSILNASSIKPFEDMTSRGFTLAFDYQIDTDYISQIYNNGYIVLCGCYSGIQNSSSSGFAIYYDVAAGVPKICFGNLSATTTYTGTESNFAIASQTSVNCRNIVVVRHKPGSNTLQIYTGIQSTGMLLELNDRLFEKELQWSNNSFDAPLCFGHFTKNTFNSVSNVRQGIGTKIYWAKYWDTDLGKDECIHLAAWPHEKLTFILEDYSNDNNDDVIKTNANNMIFSALQLSQYGGPQYQSYDSGNYHNTSTSTPGTQAVWGYGLNDPKNSLYKKIANERFFLGLPIELQSIIEKTPSSAMLGEIYHVPSGNYYRVENNVETIDLAFIPSYVEAGGNDINDIYSEEAQASMPLKKAGNCTVYTYNNGFNFNTPTGNSSNYMNLRFFGKPIKPTQNIVYDNYTASTSAYNAITANGHEIHSGDILIYSVTVENSTTTNAYIYVTQNEINAGAPVTSKTETVLQCSTGGWIEAGSWWTRSISALPSADDNFVRATNQPFYYVQGHSGELADRSIPNAGTGAYFVYSFGV